MPEVPEQLIPAHGQRPASGLGLALDDGFRSGDQELSKLAVDADQVVGVCLYI